MGDDATSLQELEPIRLRTMILAQIGELSEERRRLLRSMNGYEDVRLVRGRLVEIDQQLSQLWEIRRRELI